MNIAEICIKARALILRDGFQTGGAGWVGDGGWCIEGALGKVMGLDHFSSERMGELVNESEVGLAIKAHLQLPKGVHLHGWNDRSANCDWVIRVLAEVAAAHTPQPEPVYEKPELRILGPVIIPPMPEEKPKSWIRELLMS